MGSIVKAIINTSFKDHRISVVGDIGDDCSEQLLQYILDL